MTNTTSACFVRRLVCLRCSVHGKAPYYGVLLKSSVAVFRAICPLKMWPLHMRSDVLYAFFVTTDYR